MQTTTALDKVLLEARFSTVCPACNKAVTVGEPVIYFPSVRIAVHEDCADGCVPRSDGRVVLKVKNMDAREERGKQIAKTMRIKRKGEHYLVPSQTNTKDNYIVDLTAEDGPTCTCPDFEERGVGMRCKHIHATEYAVIFESTADGGGEVLTVTRVARTTYKQNWPKYDAAQMGQRESFVKLLRGLCEGVVQPSQSMGRPRHNLADVIFSLVWRAYSGKSLRRMTGELRDLRDRGVIESAPHFNTLSDYDCRDEITDILKALVDASALPFKDIESDFACDSSGFATSRFGRWYDEKWGRERTGKEWVKAHIMVGVKTHVITAVSITRGFGSDTSDSRQFKGLLASTADKFTVGEVSADKAYLAKRNLEAVAAVGGTAYVPFKSNSKDGSRSTLWNRLYHYFQSEREDFLTHYHKRSNVETAFSMLKRNFGDSIRSKVDTAQENDLLCKVIAHNICCIVTAIHERGLTPKFMPDTTGGDGVAVGGDGVREAVRS